MAITIDTTKGRYIRHQFQKNDRHTLKLYECYRSAFIKKAFLATLFNA